MQHRHNLRLALVLLVLSTAGACDRQIPTAPAASGDPPAVAPVTSGASAGASALSGSEEYAYEGSGDLTFDPTPATAYRGPGKKSSRVNLCPFGCGTTLYLSSDFVGQFGEEGTKCFGEGVFPDFAGLLTPDRKDSELVTGQFWFSGKGTGGVKEFKYQLQVAGTVTKTFPPAPGGDATVVWSRSSGEMMTEGKGKGKKGGNAGSACTGEVEVAGSLDLKGRP